MKICTVVGARPQFIKAAVVSRAIREHNKLVTVRGTHIKEVIIHTGQHFDDNMSKVFFDEMDIPLPDYNLNINLCGQSSSTRHGAMTGRMLEKIEDVLMKEKPDWVLVYGDTNSTLAGALAASKLHIPIAHVEAGLRSFNMKMPEEQNRVLADHISTKLFCPTDASVENLKREGITKGVHRTGDVMYDAFLYYSKKAMQRYRHGSGEAYPLQDLPDKFILLTIHRAENTDDEARLRNIVEALNRVPVEVVFPVHPRTKKMLDKFGLRFNGHVRLLEPVGYLEMIYLENRCEAVMTDSGGVQKEAYFARKPCITLRDETEWVETVEAGWNRCVDVNSLSGSDLVPKIGKCYPSLYGEGNAGAELLRFL